MSGDTTRWEREFKDGGVAKLGTFYPSGYVVAMVRDPAKAGQAAEALVAAGFAQSDVAVFGGKQVIDYHNQVVVKRHEQRRGLLERLVELFPADETGVMNEYLAEAESGASIVTVYAPERDQQTRAGATLKEHGGYAVRSYGDRTYTDL